MLKLILSIESNKENPLIKKRLICELNVLLKIVILSNFNWAVELVLTEAAFKICKKFVLILVTIIFLKDDVAAKLLTSN